MEPDTTTNTGRVIPQVIEDEMKRSYLDYAMSVIVGRALPDARDGLKPVHRRILFAMNDLGLRSNTPFKKSARIVGECFVKDTLVLTEHGLMPIQDISRGMKVFTQSGLKKITQLYEMPKRSLLKVTLENGSENTVTQSQQFKVCNANWQFVWKTADQLKPGDFLIQKTAYPDLPSKSIGGCEVNVNIGYLLGQFISDGWVSNDARGKPRICFGSSSVSIITKLSRILGAEFGYEAVIEQRENEYPLANGQLATTLMHVIRINRQAINSYLVTSFGLDNVTSKTKEIPQIILQSPRKVLAGFLSGLIDGDGSIHKERNVIHYGTISKRLSQQLIVLLGHLGCSTSLSKTPAKEQKIFDRYSQSQQFYNIEIRGKSAHLLGNLLELSCLEKEHRLKKMLEQKTGPSTAQLPYGGAKVFEELSKRHLGSGWYVDTLGKKFRSGITYKDGTKIRYSSDLHDKPLRMSQLIDWGLKEKLERIGSELSDFLRVVEKDDLTFVRVTDIASAGEDVTYDLQVADEHEFVANGVLVHNCLGKYHPHGDSAVYDALVRMAQEFSLRYPLVHGQGNFGSIDGDNAAAQRYTEAKLRKIAEEMLEDIDKETVDFVPNFDDSLKEPNVLPAKVPNLLINGSTGIAVGMATNIPPHNLVEVCAATIALIDNPDIEIQELIEHVKGPDFPTGGIIAGKSGIIQAYTHGRGAVRIKSVITHEESNRRFIVSEIPYMVNKAHLVEQIADMVKEKKIEGISDLRDESDRKGMRIVIELKRDANPEIVEKQLFMYTRLQVSFGINVLALVDGRPKVLNLKDSLEQYLLHRRVVVRRRTQYELSKAEQRAHVLEGLVVCVDNVDSIVALIKKSENVEMARAGLIEGYSLSLIQANAILDMKLQKLTGLEREKLKTELEELKVKIAQLQEILSDETRILSIIKEELQALSDKFGDVRRTQINELADEEIDLEDLIDPEDQVVTISNAGYAKRMSLDLYKEQRRGGVGVRGATTKEDDFVEHLFVANTHDYLLVFTDKGKVYWKKVYYLPESGRQSKGKPMINLIQLEKGEQINAVIPIKEFKKTEFLLFVTQNGTIKKTPLSEYGRPRQGGIRAINILENDSLVTVLKTNGAEQILLASAKGQAVKFIETDVRSMGRVSTGVRGIRLKADDFVVGAIKAPDSASVLTITANGFGKRSPIADYRLINRGGSGVRNIITSSRNGNVVAVRCVEGGEGIMLSTKNGIMIRTTVEHIRIIGRNTQGVKVMNMRAGDEVVACEKIANDIEDESEHAVEVPPIVHQPIEQLDDSEVEDDVVDEDESSDDDQDGDLDDKSEK